MEFFKLSPAFFVLIFLLAVCSAKAAQIECKAILGNCIDVCDDICKMLHPGSTEKAIGSCEQDDCFCDYKCGGSISSLCEAYLGKYSSCDKCNETCQSKFKDGKGDCFTFNGEGSCNCKYSC